MMMFGSGDGQASQKIWVNLMLWGLLAGLRLLGDRNQTHQLHRPPDPTPPALMALALHLAGHLT